MGFRHGDDVILVELVDVQNAVPLALDIDRCGEVGLRGDMAF